MKMSEPDTVANIFNDYYINLVESTPIDCHQGSNKSTHSPMFPKFYCKPVDEKEIITLINNFKNKKSCGYDEVPISVLKTSISLIVKPLVHIINSSFISGDFPQKLKISKVIPVFKKGDTKEIVNYRPISIQPTISNIFEKCMYNRLIEYFEKNKILDEEQHGYRPGRSVITAATQFIEGVINDIDKKNKVIAILMDLTKAFDRVCHDRLVQELQGCGIHGLPLKWLESFIKDRLQYVELTNCKNNFISNHKSALKKFKYSVPQGSILGPLLFISYFRGLGEKLSNINSNYQLCLYADDATLKVSEQNCLTLNHFSEQYINVIVDSLKSKNLLLNSSKTNYLIFDVKNSHSNNINQQNFILTVENDILEKTNNSTFLGLIIDDQLTWNNHVDHVCTKLSSGVFAIRKMSFYCELSSMLLLYYAHVHSHIQFGLILYGGTSHNNLNRILVFQKKAIRAMLKLNQRESCREKFKELRLFTVFSLYIFHTIIHIKTYPINNIRMENIHNYNTRNKNNFAIESHRTTLFTKQPSYAGKHFYNNIPQNIKNINDFKTFRNTLKEFLLDNPLYSIEEFQELQV